VTEDGVATIITAQLPEGCIAATWEDEDIIIIGD
jgi:hypothetical protein